eukprot:2083210-Amphidinium_carterae.2
MPMSGTVPALSAASYTATEYSQQLARSHVFITPVYVIASGFGAVAIIVAKIAKLRFHASGSFAKSGCTRVLKVTTDGGMDFCFIVPTTCSASLQCRFLTRAFTVAL